MISFRFEYLGKNRSDRLPEDFGRLQFALSFQHNKYLHYSNLRHELFQEC